MNISLTIRFACTFLCGIFAYFFGPFDALFFALVAVICIDYASGVTKAVIHGKLSSKVGFTGLLKKLLIFMLVGLSSIVDKLVPSNNAVRAAVCMFYILNEAISILENAGGIGIPLPGALIKAIEKLKANKD